MNKINKKGISTIVATVLIVLITVAAVTILWAAISPMLNVSDKTSCVSALPNYEIDTNAQYTYADATNMKIRIKNNGDDLADKIYLVVNADGDTITGLGTGEITPPNPGESKVVTVTRAASSGETLTASISPILVIDGAEVTCSGAIDVAIMNNVA